MTGNRARGDDDDRWSRPLWVALAASVGVSLIIGGVISVIALGAARVTVLAPTDGPTTAESSVYMPPLGKSTDKTTPAGPNVKPPGPDAPNDGRSGSPRSEPAREFSLQATPLAVAAGEQINLTGVYPREGATLQVQRLQGAWTDFDATATVRGGLYETYIYTSVSGVNRLRMIDLDSGKTSNPVRVRVG